ncbi:glycosyltransferase family 4 protein [Niveibacterium sp. 24ML]|uniref:glycosyltransferase family 4 protein n=1 Tax=Niveibacterium sp. 24ML TaxID=2985512 RepID=UPI00226F1593|nr:glycosyltransferase family 1 protein [Niveibacterium sp. 24ML]MCX9156665.1 glycosyltransferase family 4 protein [Niveibacterium sp. 24ML]
MNSLILNLSMLGANPTGLGVYSQRAALAVSHRFRTSILAGQGVAPSGDIIARAPASVAIGGGKLAAIRRQFWMRGLRLPENALVYSPTHHGLPGRKNQIITVHDLICLRFPSQHRPQYLFFKYGLPRLLRNCKAVFTVSETTRNDVAETYGFPRDRIFVVPNGVDRTEFGPAPSSEANATPYLLMVGARYSHKNVDEVLRMAHLWSDTYVLKVTSCSGEYRAALEREVQARGLSSKVQFLDYLSWAELKALYQNCAALVYPSKWEGFGIPPLEALACGVPVIASDIPVHREVLGEAASFVGLGDEKSWALAFSELASGLKDSPARKEAAERVLTGFTWDNSAEILKRALLAVEPKLEQALTA